MDKKEYVIPDMEITEFETEDVITTSSGSSDNKSELPEEPFV